MRTLAERVDAIEFDHPFTILNGEVCDVPGVWAPEVSSYELEDGCWSEAELDDSVNWEMVSHGWTGQYGYNGPVMHNSEYIGDRIAERLAEMAEDYKAFAVIAVSCIPLDEDAESDLDGWVIAGLRKGE